MTTTRTERIRGLVGSLGAKAPCRAVATSNITLSGEQTIDGVALVADDRALLTGQTDTTENGIYVVSTGDWERAPDFDGERDVLRGTLIPIAEGATYANYLFAVGTSDAAPGEAMTISAAYAPAAAVTAAAVAAAVAAAIDPAGAVMLAAVAAAEAIAADAGIAIPTNALLLVTGAELLGMSTWTTTSAASAGAVALAAAGAQYALVGMSVDGAGAETTAYVRGIGSTNDNGDTTPQAGRLYSSTGSTGTAQGAVWVPVNASGQFQVVASYSGGSDTTLYLYGYQ